MTPTVLLDRVGHVAVLTLNRPDVLNAVNGELTVAAGAMLEQVAADRDRTGRPHR